MSLQNKIDDVDAEIEKYNLAISATDTSAYEKLSSFQNVLNSIKQLNEQIQSTPIIRDEHITNIQKSLLNGMVLDSINYTRETHTISLSVSSTNVQTIEKYVKNLKKQNDFIAVNYSGYNEITTSSTTQTGEVDPITGLPATNTVESTSYKSTITIILK